MSYLISEFEFVILSMVTACLPLFCGALSPPGTMVWSQVVGLPCSNYKEEELKGFIVSTFHNLI